MGFDTLWTPDELLWRVEGAAPQGVWDGVSMAGAVAATTSRIKVGTWVLSALHRNPGIIAKTAPRRLAGRYLCVDRMLYCIDH